MEFYGLVRDGPRNLFSRRAAKKAANMKMKKSENKTRGEKCTNHTPLPKGGRSLVLASGTGHTQSRRRWRCERGGGG